MATLKKKKNQPVVCFPAEIEKEKQTGKLYGYFVEDTNYYNVTALADDGNKRIAEIGEVCADKPTESSADKLTGYYENGVLQFVDSEGVACKKEPYSLKLDIFSRNTGILESDIMLKTGAMLIGCGSVGSLAALELAKAGVGRFLLIDNDILGYHNICRHQCGIYDVGKYKTEAVKERILQINPTAKVVTQNMIVQEVSLSVFDEFCNKDTIVIGGADNREGDLYANQIAKEVGMPLISIGCWERAFAGEIFYCLPDGMPDYSDFMWAIGDTSGRATQNRKFYTNEEDLARAAFEPGISADIDFVTIIAVKLVLDILNRNNPNHTPRLLGHLSQYTLVCNTNNPKIGGDNAEIFSYPLQVTTSIEVPYAPKEEVQFLKVQ
ncbi:MAG: ThiF family adenylyltransferase [Prevotellaceae bacterium]|jgi:molybdopterin/thiamine biosynthesis adenylyltransferase|nr:ThiF family adenylyltransferase [Prevotellaceae bacterium]